MKKPHLRKAFPAPETSSKALIRVRPEHMMMFRYALEGYDHLAQITVLEPENGLVKVLYSPHQTQELYEALEESVLLVPIEILQYPEIKASRE